MRETYGQFRVEGRRFALVVSRTNELVTRQLLSGAVDCLRQHGADENQIEVFWVPGAWELAPVVARLARGGRHAAIVALGALIRGATPHFDYLASAATQRLANVATHSECYVSLGVLTADTLEQALERAGSKAGNHGAKAVLAAIEMADLLDRLDGESD
ncbi:MAG: 6,7-dimethyl-8-ribityllumazine synthase [Gemmatimonadetes bacterium]|uniref:6,7-dimethyl-8-ribityllumazine synthase n=1 Tax=Candidatus Kutchimonas denitrificans TaxID=3056748 RepID=A0AAE5CBD1_9BACT|nr:6,7-dimethyl-8-ribityllumazine synthase [Gemmatimonadota bacterium]NIR75692.1 6,7-dimethyl-8-ribityllumazine synthase [Candidatus Kutchimonas denitrificans]NIS00305.1 6,7-dimethyl-8-ribityllumazine synthase [Gemmatimonadota bacterium]NIT65964.1 6,7-dimethyl-8-ribityllumazine synthase [Gemmatimonadota bacterium]NIU53668.1 6,7-dimethyl-8-ribityllumazine synthase [Gemmatimonadota bacterium]